MLIIIHGELPVRKQFLSAWSRLVEEKGNSKSYYALDCGGVKPLMREEVWWALVDADAIAKSRKSKQEDVDQALAWIESILLKLGIRWV